VIYFMNTMRVLQAKDHPEEVLTAFRKDATTVLECQGPCSPSKLMETMRGGRVYRPEADIGHQHVQLCFRWSFSKHANMKQLCKEAGFDVKPHGLARRFWRVLLPRNRFV
jgi:hypothetical protein